MSRRNRETDICVSAKETIKREIYQKKWVQEKKKKKEKLNRKNEFKKKKKKRQSWGEDGVEKRCIDNFREMLRIVRTKKPLEMCVCVA